MKNAKLAREHAFTIYAALTASGSLTERGKERALDIIAQGVEKVLPPPVCEAVGCSNEGRYNSGYCGTCDVLYNEGKGVRWIDL